MHAQADGFSGRGRWSERVEAPILSPSHGEGFLQVLAAMTGETGLYVLDEPESALSFDSSLMLLTLMADMRAAGGQLLAAAIAEHNDAVARLVIPKWSALLDVIGRRYEIADDDRLGFVGLSLGAVIGMSLVASDHRIRPALLGLVAGPHLVAAAAAIEVPTQFLLQLGMINL
jgi:hypothetical protein